MAFKTFGSAAHEFVPSTAARHAHSRRRRTLVTQRRKTAWRGATTGPGLRPQRRVATAGADAATGPLANPALRAMDCVGAATAPRFARACAVERIAVAGQLRNQRHERLHQCAGRARSGFAGQSPLVSALLGSPRAGHRTRPYDCRGGKPGGRRHGAEFSRSSRRSAIRPAASVEPHYGASGQSGNGPALASAIVDSGLAAVGYRPTANGTD